MASKEMAAMLDALMGRNRNADPTAARTTTWEDEEVCSYFLTEYCPHDLFVNTKVDLGPCPNIHDTALKKIFDAAPYSLKKERRQEDFLRFCQRLLGEVDTKVRKSREKILDNKREQLAANGITPQQQEEIEMKMTILDEKINDLVTKAEEAGNAGELEEAQGIVKLADQLKGEKEDLAQSIADGLRAFERGPEGSFGPPKEMKVCDICGAQVVAAQARIDDHLMGKLHAGYAKLRDSVDRIQEIVTTLKEANELEREMAMAEKAKKNGEKLLEMAMKPAEEGAKAKSESKEQEGGEGKKSRSRERKKRSRSRDRKSRDRSSRDRKRSRSRDRKRRSRSRDRKRSRSRGGRRDRSRDRRRSRSRGRRDRSRDRKKSRSRERRRRSRSKSKSRS